MGSKSSMQHDSPKSRKAKGKGLQPKQSGIFRVKWIVLCHFSFQTAHGRSTNLGFQIHQKSRGQDAPGRGFGKVLSQVQQHRGKVKINDQRQSVNNRCNKRTCHYRWIKTDALCCNGKHAAGYFCDGHGDNQG